MSAINARPKVLFVLGTSSGGVARHVLALVTSLVALGHEVAVAAPSSVVQEFGFAAVGAQVHPVEIRDRPHPRGDMHVVRELRLLADEVDIVHAHGLRAGGLAVMALRRKTAPLVVTLHNALLAEGLGGSPIRAAYLVLERLVVRRADVVLGVCEDLTERLRQLGARRTATAVVPAPAALVPVSTPDRIRADLDLGQRPVILCIARLAEQKGLPLLLDAIQILHRSSPDVGLSGPVPMCLVAGDGPLAKRLASRIAAEGLPVRLLGWRGDIADLLSIADVVVSAAVWEGQPIAVQQALRAGTAIVATDVGGTRAVTADAAVLVPPADPAALAQALAALLADPARRAELSLAAVRRAAQLPDDAAARDAVLSIYHQLLAERAR